MFYSQLSVPFQSFYPPFTQCMGTFLSPSRERRLSIRLGTKVVYMCICSCSMHACMYVAVRIDIDIDIGNQSPYHYSSRSSQLTAHSSLSHIPLNNLIRRSISYSILPPPSPNHPLNMRNSLRNRSFSVSLERETGYDIDECDNQ